MRAPFVMFAAAVACALGGIGCGGGSSSGESNSACIHGPVEGSKVCGMTARELCSGPNDGAGYDPNCPAVIKQYGAP